MINSLCPCEQLTHVERKTKNLLSCEGRNIFFFFLKASVKLWRSLGDAENMPVCLAALKFCSVRLYSLSPQRDLNWHHQPQKQKIQYVIAGHRFKGERGSKFHQANFAAIFCFVSIN